MEAKIISSSHKSQQFWWFGCSELCLPLHSFSSAPALHGCCSVPVAAHCFGLRGRLTNLLLLIPAVWEETLIGGKGRRRVRVRWPNTEMKITKRAAAASDGCQSLWFWSTVDVQERANLRGGFLAAEYRPPSEKRVRTLNQCMTSEAPPRCARDLTFNDFGNSLRFGVDQLWVAVDGGDLGEVWAWMFPNKTRSIKSFLMHQILVSPGNL